jgi:2-polyprenyl-6-methoxyphenol hydroxylase-like FAD-dependent oxidoreductase
MTNPKASARCAIAGGGPAGMMLGLLLARAGLEVTVLEAHADFLRDFRGDTIHPSTLEVMHELGLLDELLELPHQEVERLAVQIGDEKISFADLTHLPTRCRFMALMPQWDFLNFIARQGAQYSGFNLRMRTRVTDLIEEEGRIVGLHAAAPEGPLEIRANLVVGADGRSSTVRERAGLKVDEIGAPMDVLWFAISRHPNDPEETMGRVDRGRMFIMINRGERWQCGFVISKGSIEQIHRYGLNAFRDTVAGLAPFMSDRIGELREWDDIKLLTVRVDRLPRWHRPGLLCIGDAAHAMSPVGGVGINLAIQDAVAAANLLATPLLENRLTEDHLQRVQRRRAPAARLTQWMQVQIQNRVISRVLGGSGKITAPRLFRLFARYRFLRRIPARLIGIGLRPEHVTASVLHARRDRDVSDSPPAPPNRIQ